MSRRTALALLAAVLALVAGCDAAPTEHDDAGDGAFVAVGRDFAGYEAWSRYDIPDESIPGETDGPRTIYLNHTAPIGARTYPVGTILVKVIEPDPTDASTWTVLAMAKRGGGFNSDGALGWEWFRLTLSDGDPTIDWRGTSPPPGMGYGDLPDGGLAGACNTCHGLAPTHDYVLDDGFSL